MTYFVSSFCVMGVVFTKSMNWIFYYLKRDKIKNISHNDFAVLSNGSPLDKKRNICGNYK